MRRHGHIVLVAITLELTEGERRIGPDGIGLHDGLDVLREGLDYFSRGVFCLVDRQHVVQHDGQSKTSCAAPRHTLPWRTIQRHLSEEQDGRAAAARVDTLDDALERHVMSKLLYRPS